MGKIQTIWPFSLVSTSFRRWWTPLEACEIKFKLKLNCLKTSRERGTFKMLPIDGARSCRPIGLDMILLSEGRGEGRIEDHGNKKGQSLWKPRIWIILVWTTKLEVGKTYSLYLGQRVCYARFLPAPAEDFHSWYIIWANWRLNRKLQQWQLVETVVLTEVQNSHPVEKSDISPEICLLLDYLCSVISTVVIWAALPLSALAGFCQLSSVSFI